MTGKVEKKATGCILLFVFATLLLLNFLTPLTADDFFHFRNWADEDFIESAADVFESLAMIRKGHNGRVIAHFFAIVFLQLPKIVFNVVNAAVCMALFGLCLGFFKSGEARKDTLLLASFLAFIWVMMPAFGQVFLWLTGACNYAWAILMALLFVYPYFRAWMYGEEETNALVSTIYIIVAFVAGAYSENASFSMLAAAFCFMLLCFIRDRGLKWWMPVRFAVACVGFLYLMLAPSELGTKNAGGGSGIVQKIAGLVGGAGIGVLALAAAALLLFAAVAIWLFIKHRRFFCLTGMLLCAAGTVGLVVLFAPSVEGGLYLKAQALLSDVKISLVVLFGVYGFLLLLSLLRGVDAKTILAALVFGIAALASIAVFVFAIYFPARSACPAAFYTALADVLIISALWDMGGRKKVKMLSALLVLLFFAAFIMGGADICHTYVQNAEREAVLAESRESGQSETLLETIECAGKYSVVWPREYANFNPGIAMYYGVPEVWILDIDYA